MLSKYWWAHSISRVSGQIEPENNVEVIFLVFACHYINVLNIKGSRKSFWVSKRIKD